MRRAGRAPRTRAFIEARKQGVGEGLGAPGDGASEGCERPGSGARAKGRRAGGRSSQKAMLSSYSDSNSGTVQPPSRPTLWSRKRSQGRRSRTFSMAGS